MLLIRVMDLGVAEMGFIFCGKHLFSWQGLSIKEWPLNKGL